MSQRDGMSPRCRAGRHGSPCLAWPACPCACHGPRIDTDAITRESAGPQISNAAVASVSRLLTELGMEVVE